MENKLICLLALPFFYVTCFSQNVGIGVTTPAAKLEVRALSGLNYPTLLLYDDHPTNYSRISFQNSGGPRFWTIAGFSHNTDSALSRLNFYHSVSGNVLALTGDGRLGIGNNNPAEKLDVNGHINLTGTLKFNNNPGTAGQVLTSNGTVASWQNLPALVNYWSISGNNIYNNNTGLVGIGTASPQAKTDIRHTSSLASPTLSLYDNNAGNFARLQFQNASGNKFWNISGLLNNTTDASSRLNFYHSVYGDVMSLTGDGKVGLGTTTPLTRFHVTDSSVLFSAPGWIPTLNGRTPITGPARLLFWYPAKAAFRVGAVEGTSWDDENIGEHSMAMGRSTTASGYISTAMGYLSSASGVHSTAMGTEGQAVGNASTVMGRLNTAMGAFSTAIGNANWAFGESSVVMGEGLRSNSFAEIVIGTRNLDYTPASTTTWVATDRLFTVGNGQSYDTRNNALTVLKNGNTGIGTSTPSARLHLYSNSQAGGINSQLMLEENGDDFTRITMKNTVATTKFWDLAAYTNITNANAQMNFYFHGFGDVLSLKGNGNATLAGVLTQSSDARMKKNITPIASALNGLANIHGYRYTWKEEGRDQEIQIGILAQEVQQVYPELVKVDDKGVLSVNYSGLIPVLINAVKEQQQQINMQQQQITLLLQKLNASLQK